MHFWYSLLYIQRWSFTVHLFEKPWEDELLICHYFIPKKAIRNGITFIFYILIKRCTFGMSLSVCHSITFLISVVILLGLIVLKKSGLLQGNVKSSSEYRRIHNCFRETHQDSLKSIWIPRHRRPRNTWNSIIFEIAQYQAVWNLSIKHLRCDTIQMLNFSVVRQITFSK